MKMSWWAWVVPAAAGLLLAAGCGANRTSNSVSQIRVINAVADGPAIDIYVNAKLVLSNLPFATIQPATTPASYFTVTTGNNYVQGFPTGTNVNPVTPLGYVTFAESTQYTMVAVGPEANEAPPMLFGDNNTPPMGTNPEFRVINVSPHSPVEGLDVYIVAPTVTDLSGYTPQITVLRNNSSSSYQSMPFLAGGYNVVVTQTGLKAPLITQPVTADAASITTLVLLDNLGGQNGMSTTPLVLNDLN